MKPTLAINLTVDQINYIIGALIKMPFEQVADLISLVRNQAQAAISEINSDKEDPAATVE